MISNIVAGLYVLLSFVVIGFLVYYLLRRNEENFCGKCRGIGIKTYPDKELIQKLYNSGEVTENTIGI